MWRVILDRKRKGALNMAIDEALLEMGTPTFRIYGWEEPTVTIGRLQRAREAVNLEECERRGIEVIRRISGGGSVIHDREITYCIIGREETLGKGPEETFSRVLSLLVKFLEELGIEGAKEGINDISVKGKKISGNAQARRKEKVLQHGTILLDIDKELMDSLIMPPKEKLKEKNISKPSERVTSVKEILGRIPSRNEIIEAMLRAFEQVFGEFEIGSYNPEELELARSLEREKYGRKEWLLLK